MLPVSVRDAGTTDSQFGSMGFLCHISVTLSRCLCRYGYMERKRVPVRNHVAVPHHGKAGMAANKGKVPLKAAVTTLVLIGVAWLFTLR